MDSPLAFLDSLSLTHTHAAQSISIRISIERQRLCTENGHHAYRPQSSPQQPQCRSACLAKKCDCLVLESWSKLAIPLIAQSYNSGQKIR